MFLYPSSITKQEKHIYDYVATNTAGHDHPIKKSTTIKNNDIAMDVNPAYGEGALFTIKATEDAEYEVVDCQSKQVKRDDIKMDINPAYAETKFT